MSYGQPPQDPNQQQGYQQPPQQQGYPPAAGQNYQVPSSQQIQAGIQGFSLGRKILLGAGLLTVILFFLPWYTFSVSTDDPSLQALITDSSASANGLRSLPLIGFLILLVVLAALALPLAGRRLRDIVKSPLSEGQIGLFGSAAVLALSLLGGLLAKPSNTDSTSLFAGTGVEASWSFGIGFWLASLALIAMTVGGWLMYQARE